MTGVQTCALPICMILAPIMEQNFVNSMLIYDNDMLIFFKRPISLVILLLTAFLVWSFMKVNKKVDAINKVHEEEIAAE